MSETDPLGLFFRRLELNGPKDARQIPQNYRHY